jgi:SAM-dependent methyltransferase
MSFGGASMVDLAPFRDKWREAPQGSDTDGRIFSSDLLALPDDALLARWEAMAARRAAGELGWFAPLYADTFRERRVLELGSGLGFDALRFAERGARWTCADIVADNLALIRRIAALKKLEDRIDTHLIADDLSFAGLAPGYDVVWVFGSIHHVPFDTAREEALSALALLKPGGRWMELVYPRERWLREGAPPFEAWGRLTDGERTPWAEWHDVEKVLRRLAPAPLRILLDFGFCADNYRWIDLQYASAEPFLRTRAATVGPPAIDLQARDRLELTGGKRPLLAAPWEVVCPPGLFADAARLDLRPHLAELGDPAAVVLDLELQVTRGAVGIGLADELGEYLPAAEAVIAAGEDWRPVTLRAATGRPASLRLRNLHAGRRGRVKVRAAVLRVVP